MPFIKTVFYQLLCLLLMFSVAVSNASGITAQEEEEMAEEFLKYVQRQYEVIDDPLIVAYVNKVGKRVLTGFLPQPFQYHFNVIKQDIYNAFAGPGGHIYVNSGLLAAMDTENELAGILSHEIAHVASRHISEKIGRSGKIEAATLAGVVAGIFLGAAGGGAAASALTIGSMAAGQSVILAYSRDDEREADKVGLKNLYLAGYTGEGLLAIMKKIRSKQWFGETDIPSYLTTHPGSEERIVYIGNWVASHAQYEQGISWDDFEFKRIKTRLVALYGDEQLALRQFEGRTRDTPGDFFAHYGYGLVLARTGHQGQAIVELKKALEQRAFDPYLPTDIGQAYFLDGQYEAALKLLLATVPTAVDSGRLLYLGRVQMELGQLETAKKTFLSLLAKDPDYSDALYYLGDAYGKLAVMDEAHFYLGSYYKKRGNDKKAVFHFKRALDKATTDENKAKIKKQLEELSRKKKKKKKKTEEKKPPQISIRSGQNEKTAW